MRISKVLIKNYKCFKDAFEIEFSSGVNIIVGANEAGKSTILEAIHLALTGMLHGRYLRYGLSQYLFNNEVVAEYLANLRGSTAPAPPEIVIEVHFDADNLALFEGNGNEEREKSCGVSFKIAFDAAYKAEYDALLADGSDLATLPIEYYTVEWRAFSRDAVTARLMPIKSVLIDSTSPKYQNGSDIYISRIIRDDLEDSERVKLSQAYRKMKEAFITDESIVGLNKKISENAKRDGHDLSVSVDLSNQNAWETTLIAYLDEVPFHQLGKGEQCVIKTHLALAHKRSRAANLILLEEPENHLSHTRMSQLIKAVASDVQNKQVIVSTHSSFVANKLGLDKLILLSSHVASRLTDLPKDTYEFFQKLPGYETLRMVLSKRAVLVEGDSDELIFQRAYMDAHDGHLPIEDGIDVISVGLTFKRFLDIARIIGHSVSVVTDNDGDYQRNITHKYRLYSGLESIKVFADPRNDLHTLEPQFADANRERLSDLCSVLGVNDGQYGTTDAMARYLQGRKTEWALRVFESEVAFSYPEYIVKAIAWCHE